VNLTDASSKRWQEIHKKYGKPDLIVRKLEGILDVLQ